MNIVHSQAKTTFFLNGLKLRSGRAYYECTLVSKMSLKRKNFAPLFLGWIDAEYVKLRCGDEFSYSEESERHRWRIRLEDISAKTRSSRPLVGKIGDIIGCGIDIDRKTIVFSLNGSFPHRFGVRHRNFQFSEWVSPSVVVHGCTVSLNFGEAPFQYSMSGYPSVSDRMKQQRYLDFPFLGTPLRSGVANEKLFEIGKDESKEIDSSVLQLSSPFTKESNEEVNCYFWCVE